MTVLLNRDRYTTSGVIARKRGVVVHDSESGDNSYAALVSYMKAPGDRDNGHGGKYGSGYHAVTDGLGGYTLMADASAGPYAAPPTNGTWWHVCIPGAASQTRDDWLLDVSRLHIKGVARFIVDRWREDGESWDITSYLIATDLVRGRQGITSHREVSNAWHQSDHSDPGPLFPWDILLSDVTLILHPVKPDGPFTAAPGRAEPPAPRDDYEEDEMPLELRVGTNSGIWWKENGELHHCAGDELDGLRDMHTLDDGTKAYGVKSITDESFDKAKGRYTIV